MKKLFVTICLAVAAMAANAQTYVGGELGFWRNGEDGNNKTSFTLAPELGYNLDDTWALGIKLGYNYNYAGAGNFNIGNVVSAEGHVTRNTFTVEPYVRASYAKFGPVRLFIDGGFAFATYKDKYTATVNDKSQSESNDAHNAWQVGFKPGVALDLNDHFSFIAHAGFLGYRHSDPSKYNNALEDGAYGNGWGFDFKTNGLTFGFLYNF